MTAASDESATGRCPGGVGAPAEVVTVTPNPALDWTLSVPGFTAGAVNRVEAQSTTPAGKGVNVAAALASAGHRVAATGWLGADNAAAFEAFFAHKGIEDRFVRVAGETRIGIKINDPSAQPTTDVNFPGREPSPSERAALMERALRLAGTSASGAPAWFVLAGSLPPGVDPGFYCELATLVAAAGARVALDTGGEPLRRALKSEPQVLKPNVRELEALVGAPLPSRDAIVAAARGLLKGGTELVVVSMGADGALFLEDGRIVAATPPRVAVRATVGAGDALMAGIVSARLRRLDLAELARLASAFALEAVTGKAAAEWLGEVRIEAGD
jgi:1-phosphofructokinase family hexose kinase